ncbi:MAG: glucuronyl hydrolase, partial [Tannerellaceae bacterium]
MQMSEVISLGLDRAKEQSILMAEALKDKPGRLPKSTDKEGKLSTSDSRWWCSGFFPGVLWYVYEGTNDPELKEWARMYTARIEREKYTTNNHDVGFMLYCSFGNGLRLGGYDAYKEVLLTGTESLSTRYKDNVGAIRSWDWNQKVWQYPVIIDNMMNLELMMWAAKESGNKRFAEMAKSHADKTMKNH